MKRTIAILFSFISLHISAFERLHIRDTYSRELYKEVYKSTSNPHIKRLIENTVLINTPQKGDLARGTGLYLGKHNSKHLFMTNEHVLSKRFDCEKVQITFLKKGLQQGYANCEEILVAYGKNIKMDMTLFTISDDDAERMLGQGLELDPFSNLTSGTKLVHNGFGVKRPASGSRARDLQKKYNPKVGKDDDCVIVSPNGTLKTISTKGGNVANTFTIGCDISSGDSGSALLDRETGKVIGLIWGAGESLDDDDLISSQELHQKIVGSNDERVWKNMGFAISIPKIYSFIKYFVEER